MHASDIAIRCSLFHIDIFESNAEYSLKVSVSPLGEKWKMKVDKNLNAPRDVVIRMPSKGIIISVRSLQRSEGHISDPIKYI
ncbi:hypothetical protein M5D96_012043, partial [Drosophila gunungcola]